MTVKKRVCTGIWICMHTLVITSDDSGIVLRYAYFDWNFLPALVWNDMEFKY